MKELGYFVYQIYPKSFNDTTGNGIGDINGIIQKLDYIKDLGFDYIWITPMYVSPQNDNGYDVADYKKIDPLFGTDEEFDLLISEASKRGLKIMMDMVFNHTSSEHEWFQKALAGDKKYMDYYIFKDEPTTWESKFGGNTWEYVESLGKYYLHLFDVTQPDLNWENEEVRQEIYDIINFWIDKGVYGFRFDVINLISKHYPLKNGTGDGRDQYTDGPRVHEFLKQMRANTFKEKEGFLTVGEMSSTSIDECLKYASNKRDELDSVFHFHHLKVDYEDAQKWSKDYFDFNMLKNLFIDWQTSMNEANVVDTLFWSNHDQPRVASRFVQATNRQDQIVKNKTLALMMYLMRGISYIYQGEELGLENIEFTSYDDIVDVESKNFFNSSDLPSDVKLEILNQKSRDNGRSPMLWNKEGGFSTSKPWVKHSKLVNNLEDQIGDSNSTYNFYKTLIGLKKNDPVFIHGDIQFEDHDELIIYTREYEGATYKVVCNVFDKQIEYKDIVKDVIINNNIKLDENGFLLNPFSTLVYKV